MSLPATHRPQRAGRSFRAAEVAGVPANIFTFDHTVLSSLNRRFKITEYLKLPLMVSVSEATAVISKNRFTPSILSVKVENATGKVLAEPIAADRDLPPFNRVSMDGIAIAFAEWAGGRRSFAVAGTVAAGEDQRTLADPSQCFEVMTGAVLPAGCDTVIRYEDLEIAPSGTDARILVESITPWQSVHRRGADATRGALLLEPGIVLSPSEVALLSSVGKAMVKVYAFPRTAIISTGDELVDIADDPAPWQIRRSNSYALQSALRQMGGDGTCFHLQDEETAMETKLRQISQEFDLLLLSGGVSKGKFDFVPQVLERIGIQKAFHQVSQRPGKPFWFGTSAFGKVAFALPGNPVSTFMCFYRYVRPFILESFGVSVPPSSAILAKDYAFTPQLTCFLQVAVRNEGGRAMAYPAPGGGSGDFANLKNVSGFLELPLEKNDFKAGEVFPYISFRE